MFNKVDELKAALDLKDELDAQVKENNKRIEVIKEELCDLA